MTKLAKTVLVTRFCRHDMASAWDSSFIWPKSGLVKAPDWRRIPRCGNGLHGWLEGKGHTEAWSHAQSDVMLVVEVLKKDVVNLDGKVKFSKGNVIFCGTRAEVTAFMKERGYDHIAYGEEHVKGKGTATALGVKGQATAGRGGTAIVGDFGNASSGNGGTSIAGYRGRAVSGVEGTARAGNVGSAEAGSKGSAFAGERGRAHVGNYGTATTGVEGVATAGCYGTAIAGRGGRACAGKGGTAIAGDYGSCEVKGGGKAKVGHGGNLTFRHGRNYICASVLREGHFKSDTLYHYNPQTKNIEEVAKQLLRDYGHEEN